MRGGRAAAGLCALLVAAGCGDGNRQRGGPVPAPLCASGTLDAQGSSAQRNAMDRWRGDYQRSCPGATVNYEPSGSGTGIRAFLAGTAELVGTDTPLKAGEQVQADARCSGGRAVSLPMVVGPVAVAYRLEGVAELRLSPATLAKLFGGAIRRWDDPAVRADNPGVTLPPTDVRAVHRQDSSGTTETFTRYLTASAPADWRFGSDRDWPAPAGTGAAGSERVASMVRRTDGAIGYLELSYARRQRLAVAAVRTGADRFVAPSGAAAVRSVQVPPSGLAAQVDPTPADPAAYPIVLITSEVVCDRGRSADRTKLLRGFLGYAASAEGQQSIARLGYAALPEELRLRVRAAVDGLS